LTVERPPSTHYPHSLFQLRFVDKHSFHQVTVSLLMPLTL
jgi:hypothetical protein